MTSKTAVRVWLNPIAQNQTELHIYPLARGEEEKVLFFSYSTPVAMKIGDSLYQTSKKFSITTSRHINKWLDGREAEKIPQEELEQLLVIG